MQRFEREIEIDAPVERVFDMLGDFESYPRWMEGVREVRRADRKRTHWIVETALDTDVEWDAETVVYAPDHRIAWRTVHGDVHADGEAVLTEMRPGSTHLRFMMGYDTPSGRTGERVARFFGEHPEKRLADDLSRLKRLVERSAAMRQRSADGPERGFDGATREPKRNRRDRIERDEREANSNGEPSPRRALTPREREAARETARADEARRNAGRFEQRGIDKLLDDPPSRRWHKH